MKLLALDLGTTSGYALGVSGAVISGSQSFANRRFDGGGMRFVRFRTFLAELYAATPFERVVYEEVRAHKGVDAAHVYGGLMATLTAWCEEKAIPYEGVPVGAIKRYATGKGNAKKDAIIAAVSSWGFKPVDDNEADALALLHLKLAEEFLA